MNKFLFTFLLLAISVSCQSQPKLEESEVISVINGLLKGLLDQRELPDLQKCMNDFSNVSDKIEQAIYYFEKKDFDNVIKGINYIGEAFQILSTGLKDCKEFASQSESIQEYIHVFNNLTLLEENIKEAIENQGVILLIEFMNALSALENHRYEYFGQIIGDIIRKAIINSTSFKTMQNQNDEQLAFETFEAFLKAVATDLQDAKELKGLFAEFGQEFLNPLKGLKTHQDLLSHARSKYILRVLSSSFLYLIDEINTKEKHMTSDYVLNEQLNKVLNVRDDDINNQIINELNSILNSIYFGRWSEVGFNFGKIVEDINHFTIVNN